jgi:hypothetical protein
MGLSVEATPREITQRAQRIQMMQRYNAEATPKTPLALDPPPDENAVRKAVHKLHDPEKRQIDESFSFWPHQLGQSKTDQALALLSENDIDGAAEQWRQMEKSSEACVSMHNLAVLFHCLALDLEQVALSRKLHQKELAVVGKYWADAFSRWKALLDHEPFWSRLTARIRALEDPRLTTGLARRIRASLPLGCLSINAALAVRYAEAGNLEAVRRQLKIMRLWGDSGLSQRALRQACEPIRKRINSICMDREKRADREPTRADKTTREVIEQTQPLLAILDALLPAGDAMREAAHDEDATCALHCQVAYANKAENWRVSLKLLELALPIAVGKAARDRISENMDIVRNNLAYPTCWFCQQNPAEDEASIEVKMYGDVNRIPTRLGVQITWRHCSVKVPRCLECKKAHSKKDFAIGGAIVRALVGTAIFPLIGTLAGCWVGYLIGKNLDKSRIPKGVKPESAKSEFPSVKRLLSQGWQFGEGPST